MSPPKASFLMNGHQLHLLVRELEARGLETTACLDRCGVSREQLASYGAGVAAARGLKLLGQLAELGGDPLLGLRAGLRAQLSDLDIAGLLLRASPDIDAALSVFDQMTEATASVFSTTITPLDDGAIAIRYLPQFGSHTPRIAHDTFLSAALTMSRAVLGPYLPIAAHLATAPPPDPSTYERLLGPVVFEMPCTQLLVPEGVVAAALPHSDAITARVLEPHLNRLVSPPEGGIVARVEFALTHELGWTPVTIERIATRLHLSPRTLRRLLQAEGTTFQSVLDATRHALAERFLVENPAASGCDAAAMLGYSDPAAFYRAFKRWTGRSLTQWRRYAVPSSLREATPGPAHAPAGQETNSALRR